MIMKKITFVWLSLCILDKKPLFNYTLGYHSCVTSLGLLLLDGRALWDLSLIFYSYALLLLFDLLYSSLVPSLSLAK